MTKRSILASVLLWTVGCPLFQQRCVAELTHTPMRPLPVASRRGLPKRPHYFVDAERGDDSQAGTRARPWKSINHALYRVSAGDTLLLRGGTYYERLIISKSGEEDRPITIRSFPGELAIVDGGLREFKDDPASAWVPYAGGAKQEFISTRKYPQFSRDPIVTAFPAAGWEPFYGKNAQRPVVLGHFADSMVPLHGYRTALDLRDDSMLWDVDNKFQQGEGVYCGPGLWFNRGTQRIHVRLAHTTLQGLGKRHYRGPTDPRKVPLCVSAPHGADVLRINGIRHLVIQDLVLRGAAGSPLINLYGSHDITFDGLTIYGGSPGLLVKATSKLRIVHSAFRGLSAPWSSRASMKYRGTPSYRIISQRNKPESHDCEIAFSEFTDDHDGIWIRYIRNLRFHHNLVDNFNDDGIEVGARKGDHLIYVYQNRISRCLLTFTLHQMDRDESPAQVEADSGVYICRNLIDLRPGVFRGPPKQPDPQGAYLRGGSTLCGDHGSPVWPNYFFYHNTVLRNDASWRGYYGFGMGGRATRGTRRRLYNNIFLQMTGLPGLAFASGPDDTVVDGNLHWSLSEGPKFRGDFFKLQGRRAAFRRQAYPASWMAHDVFADPKFRSDDVRATGPFDFRLSQQSPAVNAGVPLPKDWFDPVAGSDKDAADIGAIPLGQDPWRFGPQNDRFGK